VDTVELTGYVRNLPFDDHILSRFLPPKQVEGLDFKFAVGGLTDVDSAQYRALDAELPLGRRPGVARVKGQLLPLGEKYLVGEELALRLDEIREGDNAALVSQIYDDAATGTRNIQNRLEHCRAELMDTGKVTITENGIVGAEADYGRDVSLDDVLTGTELWSDLDDSDPITNMLTWVDTYTDINGVPPGAIAMGRTVRSTLLRNDAVKAAILSVFGVNTTIATQGQLAGVLDGFGLPPILPMDQRAGLGGTRTRILPEHRVWMLPPASEVSKLGATLWSTTIESLRLVRTYRIVRSEAPGIVAMAHEEFDSGQSWTKVSALAIPAMANPNLVSTATVLTP
jgi:hypothetical protein